MKKILIALLAIMLASSLVLGACESDSTPASVIELRLASQVNAGERGTAYQAWADEIEEATNGEVVITIYPSSTLIGEEDMISGVRSGLTDIGDVVVGLYSEQFPLNNILQLPFLSLGEKDNYYSILLQLWDEFPEMAAEFEDFKILYISGFGDGGLIHTTNTPVCLPEDVAGLQIMSPGTNGEIMATLGASPVFMPVADWYTSLERGLLDAMQMPWNGILDTGVYPLLTYNTVFPSVAALGMDIMVISMDKWNELSAEAQEAIEEVCENMSEQLMQIENDTNTATLALLESEGHTITWVTEEEEELWFNTAVPIHASYLASLDAQGLPATEIYQRALELAD